MERIVRLGLVDCSLSRAAQAREGEGQGEKYCDDAHPHQAEGVHAKADEGSEHHGEDRFGLRLHREYRRARLGRVLWASMRLMSTGRQKFCSTARATNPAMTTDSQPVQSPQASAA